MGWANQIGHWQSTDKGLTWTRMETVLQKASLWSAMPFFDDAANRWKFFYCNESVGDTRTAVASKTGRDSIKKPQAWTFSANLHPSVNTYSISNPFQRFPRPRLHLLRCTSRVEDDRRSLHCRRW